MPKFDLCVHPNRRYLMHRDGAPFFYLGDTVWELFHRLNFEEADHYLATRAAQGFTVVQAVVLAELDGLRVPNANGDLPLIDLDPRRPNEAYFAHVDRVVARANELGIVVGMLPTWGDKYNASQWGVGPEIFDSENSVEWGRFLGDRYGDAGIIWILGGDRPLTEPRHWDVNRGFAQGIRASRAKGQLITFHPCGGQTSSQYFHHDDWLDFNMAQTGHRIDRDNYNRIAQDYVLEPVKPCMDGEPGYEDHKSDFREDQPYMDETHVRKFAYWALFAGAHGHTYGAHGVWQCWDETREKVTWVRTTWRDSLNLPGADQMRHVRKLIESRPFFARMPDQRLIADDTRPGPDHIRACRHEEGDYAFVYSATGQPFRLNFKNLGSGAYTCSWYDPRTGEFGPTLPVDTDEFRPPTTGPGCDWVLVVDRV